MVLLSGLRPTGLSRMGSVGGLLEPFALRGPFLLPASPCPTVCRLLSGMRSAVCSAVPSEAGDRDVGAPHQVAARERR